MGFITDVLETKKGSKFKKVFYKVKKKVDKKTDKAEYKIKNYLDEKISYDDFKKVEIKIGKILTVEKVKNSDGLLKLSVDFGGEEPVQVISGISKNYNADKLVGKKTTFITNLEPKKIFGLISSAMILGLSDDKKGFSLLVPEKENIKIGTKAS